MDVTKLDYPSDMFDAIIDKATMDSLLCSDKSPELVFTMLKEVYRVLKPTGYYFVISHASPDSRLHYFKDPEFKWTIETVTIEKEYSTLSVEGGGQPCIYVYLLKKKNN